jgi:nucleoside-specific outer membrane channel protein Tsx
MISLTRLRPMGMRDTFFHKVTPHNFIFLVPKILYRFRSSFMWKKILAILLCSISGASMSATSISVLYGEGFRDDLGYRSDKTTLTIEHFGIWELGTVFFYFDITEPTTNDGNISSARQDAYSNQFFGGIAPTFSLTRMTGHEFNYGIIKDLSIRLEIENGSGNGQFNFQNYFYGLQYDLSVPGFDFLSLNTVIRDNPRDRGVGFQIGGFWQISWDYGPWNRYKFTGFFATSPWDGDQDPDNDLFAKRGRYLTTQPQLLWDLGNGWFGKPNRMELGVEYAVFLNRFQQRNRDEKVLQAMVKLSW